MGVKESCLPVGYVDIADVKAYLPADLINGVSDAALNIQIATSKEMIDSHFEEPFSNEAVPSIVKSVSLDLIRVLLTDITVQSESIGNGDYSKSQNNKAFDQILARLNYVMVDSVPLSAKCKTVRVRVV